MGSRHTPTSEPGEELLHVDSYGLVALAVRGGRADRDLGLGRLDRGVVQRLRSWTAMIAPAMAMTDQ